MDFVDETLGFSFFIQTDKVIESDNVIVFPRRI